MDVNAIDVQIVHERHGIVRPRLKGVGRRWLAAVTEPAHVPVHDAEASS